MLYWRSRSRRIFTPTRAVEVNKRQSGKNNGKPSPYLGNLAKNNRMEKRVLGSENVLEKCRGAQRTFSVKMSDRNFLKTKNSVENHHRIRDNIEQ